MRKISCISLICLTVLAASSSFDGRLSAQAQQETSAPIGTPEVLIRVARSGESANVGRSIDAERVPATVSGFPNAIVLPQVAGSAGLVIAASIDSSITSDPNSAVIQAMISQAIAIYQAQFSDPITVNILFRYSTKQPDGSAMGSGALAQSNYGGYVFPWSTYVNALLADAKTSSDSTANASLPSSPPSTSVFVNSATGRAIGLNTPPVSTATGAVASGAPYDGVVTLNAGFSFQFTRPTPNQKYDALRTLEHEIDEVLGLGTGADRGSRLQPSDLFSWSAPGTRSFSSNGSRYFSINGGITNIVGFNQDSNGDAGDWLSGSCPQVTPYVQNAFGCAGQSADVSGVTPESVNLDVIGYDSVGGGGTIPTPTAGAPGAPAGFTATASGSNVSLAWSAPTTGGAPTAYTIEAGSSAGAANLANFSTGNTLTTFGASGVGSGVYYVRVKASNASGVGPASNEATMVVGGACTAAPGPPTNFVLTGNSGGTVSFSWTAASGSPTTYVVEAGSASGLANLANSDLGSAATSFTATGVGRGTYFVRLKGKNACGTGAASNEVVLVVP